MQKKNFAVRNILRWGISGGALQYAPPAAIAVTIEYSSVRFLIGFLLLFSKFCVILNLYMLLFVGAAKRKKGGRRHGRQNFPGLQTPDGTRFFGYRRIARSKTVQNPVGLKNTAHSALSDDR